MKKIGKESFSWKYMEYFVEMCYNLVRFSSVRIYDFNAVFSKGVVN